MKTLIAVLLGTVVSIGSVGRADTSIIKASTLVTDLGAGERPSCDMLAWRWIMGYSRLTDASKALPAFKTSSDIANMAVLLGRVPGGNPEGSDELVTMKIFFKSPDIKADNVDLQSINTAGMDWQNVTKNSTDRVTVNVQEGVLTVVAQMTYSQYCFYPRASWIQMLIGGQSMTFSWDTPEIDLSSYWKKLQ